MAVETAADRLEMLSDFGESVTYTPDGGSPSTITTIFDDTFEDLQIGEAGLSTGKPVCLCRTADVSDATEGATIQRGAVIYTVRIVMADGTGMTELQLEEPA